MGKAAFGITNVQGCVVGAGRDARHGTRDACAPRKRFVSRKGFDRLIKNGDAPVERPSKIFLLGAYHAFNELLLLFQFGKHIAERADDGGDEFREKARFETEVFASV